MNERFNFEGLKVFQEAVGFSVRVYETTKGFPKEELYGLISQLRRASISIVSNICEGSNRGKNDFKRYLDIARGSLLECVGQLRIARELKFLNEKDENFLYQFAIKLSKMLTGLKASLK